MLTHAPNIKLGCEQTHEHFLGNPQCMFQHLEQFLPFFGQQVGNFPCKPAKNGKSASPANQQRSNIVHTEGNSMFLSKKSCWTNNNAAFKHSRTGICKSFVKTTTSWSKSMVTSQRDVQMPCACSIVQPTPPTPCTSSITQTAQGCTCFATLLFCSFSGQLNCQFLLNIRGPENSP